MTPDRKLVPWWLPAMGEEEKEALCAVVDDNYANEGDRTTRFEEAIAAFVGAEHGIAVTSGTTALALALMGLGIGRGDEVIVPDLTFIATANAVRLAGATPVLADIDPATLNLDPEDARTRLTERTRAILPVHISGRGQGIDALCDLAEDHGLLVVEDAAEALGGRIGGRGLGTWGDAGCFSFSPNKTITTGQGGVIVTDDDALERRLRELKDQGRPVRGTGGADDHLSLGFNFKLTNLQTAVGLAQFERLPGRLEHQRMVARTYQEILADAPGLRLPGFDLDGGEVPQWVEALTPRRDELEATINDLGYECRRFWYPLHTQAPYKGAKGPFPEATRASAEALWLPSALHLSEDEVRTVAEHVRAWTEATS